MYSCSFNLAAEPSICYYAGIRFTHIISVAGQFAKSIAVYRCDKGGENGVTRLASVRCPGGLGFDIDRQTCDWKTHVKNCDKLESKFRRMAEVDVRRAKLPV